MICNLVPAKSSDFAKRMFGVHGEKAGPWLEGLPSLIKKIAKKWKIEIVRPLDDPSFNYILEAQRQDGKPVIVKLGVPCKEILTEIAALQYWDGQGAVRLLAQAAEDGAFLLERLLPGETLHSVKNDEEATRIACSVMKDLWKPIKQGELFPTTEDWGRGFARMRKMFSGGTGPLPQKLTDEAEKTFAQLLATSKDCVLLHGDLHHWNILSIGRGRWKAIDPKGVIGEPAYEVGAWLRNPLPALLRLDDLDKVMEKRISIMEESLSISATRIRQWAFSQLLLSAYWCIEDNCDGWENCIPLAEILLKQLKR